MDFAKRQRDPTRHLIGIAFVILVHALVIWALLTGLASKAIQVIKKPLNATIIEEIKLPPPPPAAAAAEEDRAAEGPGAGPALRAAAGHPAAGRADRAGDLRADHRRAHRARGDCAAASRRRRAAGAARTARSRRCDKACRARAPRSRRSRARRSAPRVEKGKVDAILSIDEKGNVTDVRITNSEPPRVFDRVVEETLVDVEVLGRRHEVPGVGRDQLHAEGRVRDRPEVSPRPSALRAAWLAEPTRNRAEPRNLSAATTRARRRTRSSRSRAPQPPERRQSRTARRAWRRTA